MQSETITVLMLAGGMGICNSVMEVGEIVVLYTSPEKDNNQT